MGLGMTGAAFVGAVLAVMLTLALARGVQQTLRLLLAGVVVGNALNYREHAIGQLKAALTDQRLRLHRQRRSV
jgi:ABC-type Fe3+-siderophore transport system permease subunit